jgi:hypothetical protein
VAHKVILLEMVALEAQITMQFLEEAQEQRQPQAV